MSHETNSGLKKLYNDLQTDLGGFKCLRNSFGGNH